MQQPGLNHPLLDQSPAGKFRTEVATEAFEQHYDVTRQFINLNPDFQRLWIEVTGAVIKALAARGERKKNGPHQENARANETGSATRESVPNG